MIPGCWRGIRRGKRCQASIIVIVATRRYGILGWWGRLRCEGPFFVGSRRCKVLTCRRGVRNGGATIVIAALWGHGVIHGPRCSAPRHDQGQGCNRKNSESHTYVPPHIWGSLQETWSNRTWPVIPCRRV